jgi:hypothetical protein
MSKPLWQKLLNLAVEDETALVLSCPDCYDLMDQYAELLLAGEDPAEVMLLVKAHLDHCPGCDELFESLMIMLQNQDQAGA